MSFRPLHTSEQKNILLISPAGPERGGHTQVVQGRSHPQGLDCLHGADEEVHRLAGAGRVW